MVLVSVLRGSLLGGVPGENNRGMEVVALLWVSLWDLGVSLSTLHQPSAEAGALTLI